MTDKKPVTESELIVLFKKEWYEEYIKYLNIPSIKDFTITFSQVDRFIQNFQLINALSLYDKIHYISTVFKISVNSNINTNCIYGYLFSINKNLNEHFDNQSFEHQYYSFGSTYTSQDGEYRSRFLPYIAYEKLQKVYPDLLEIIEKYVIKLMNTNKINLYCDICYPSDIVINESLFRSCIKESRMAIKLFMLCFITDYYHISNKTQPNHMYPGYDLIMHELDGADATIKELRAALNNIEQEKKIINSIDKKMSIFETHCSSPIIINIASKLSNLIKNPQLRIGVKFIPLTVQEAKECGNIIYDTWKEYFITRKISELVLNLIAPNFSYITSWFIIQNTTNNFYDGFSMNQKYKYSALSDELIHSFNNDRKKLKSKDSSTNVDVYLNPDFKELSDRLLRDMLFTNTYLRLSDLSLGVTGEYLGRTFLDIDKMLSMDEYYQIHDIFKNEDIFDGLIFGLLYALFSLNSKLSISHNDLHLNNITLYQYVRIKSKVEDNSNYPIIKNAYTLYHINDKTEYLLKNVGYFIGIIDFSRALIGSHDIIKEVSEDMYRQTLKDQRNKYMYLLEKKFPKLFKDKKDKLESLLLTNLPLMFKILSGLDTFDVCLRIRSLFNKIVKQYNDTILKTLTGLIIRSEKLVLKHLEAAINDRLKSADEIKYPNYELMEETFSKYLITDQSYKEKVINYRFYRDIPKKDGIFSQEQIDKDKIIIIDAFNHSNKIKYYVDSKLEHMPPWVDFEIEKKIRKETGAAEDQFIKKFDEFVKLPIDENPLDGLTYKYEHELSNVGNSTSWLV